MYPATLRYRASVLFGTMLVDMMISDDARDIIFISVYRRTEAGMHSISSMLLVAPRSRAAMPAYIIAAPRILARFTHAPPL